MRRKATRIRLHRETLARLEADTIGAALRAIGGDTEFSVCEVVTECPSNCYVSCQPGCGAGGTQLA